MWLFSKNSFLSIVKDKEKKDSLLVRARFNQDINKLFPRAKVTVGGGTDYLYRASIPRKEVVKKMMEQVSNIEYTNFKNSNDHTRHAHLLDVWEVMIDAQDEQANVVRYLLK